MMRYLMKYFIQNHLNTVWLHKVSTIWSNAHITSCAWVIKDRVSWDISIDTLPTIIV